DERSRGTGTAGTSRGVNAQCSRSSVVIGGSFAAAGSLRGTATSAATENGARTSATRTIERKAPTHRARGNRIAEESSGNRLRKNLANDSTRSEEHTSELQSR